MKLNQSHILAISAFLLFSKPKKKKQTITISGVEGGNYHPVYITRGGMRQVHAKIGRATKKSGIYYIKENGKLIYIGYSKTNLYKTILRHFQEWNDAYQSGRISYKDKLNTHQYTVKIEFMPPKQAELVECQLIVRHKPRDNKRKNYWSRSECQGGWTNERAYITDPKSGEKIYYGEETEKDEQRTPIDDFSDPSWNTIQSNDKYISDDDIPF